MPQVERVVLANRLVLLVSEDHFLPFVTLQFLTDSGARRDPPGKEGLADLTARASLGTSSEISTPLSGLDFMELLTSSSGRIMPR
jgi:predicted Zn-dependent peptidase